MSPRDDGRGPRATSGPTRADPERPPNARRAPARCPKDNGGLPVVNPGWTSDDRGLPKVDSGFPLRQPGLDK